MNRKMRVAWCFLVMGILFLGLTLGMTCKKKNQPPGVPAIPSGPTSGRKGDTLRFSTIAEDPDGDSVAVRFDWGDSTMSDWSALVPNGDSVAMTHVWQKLATYSIRAQARDTKDTASAWSGEHQLAIASFTATFGGSGCDEGWSVQQTSDSGFIITGYTTSYGAGGGDLWLVKTDASGNKVWDDVFGGTLDDYGNSVQQTSDGGYITTGWTYFFGAGSSDAWLIKTDASGNKTWDRTFGGLLDDGGSSVRQTSDGGYIIAGTTNSYGAGSNDFWLIKTDASGNHVWDKTFGGVGDDEGHSVQQTSDGGYIVAGNTNSYGSGSDNIWLVKTDASGNEVWDKTLGEALNDGGHSVQQTSDGGYIVVGTTTLHAEGGFDAWLVKTDSLGNKVWDKTLGGPGQDGGQSVQQTSDGGYIIAGTTEFYGAGGRDFWLVKTDADGNMVWDRTFGGTRNDEGYSAQQTSDGGYVIAGSTDLTGARDFDVLLIKTDANGN
jgi:hypothetical protein